MLQFKITSCPEKSQLGIYQHEATQMSIGSSDADMVVDDPGIAPKQVQIALERSGFTIVNLEPKTKVQLNGKALKGKPIPFKSNDNLSLGSTTIFFMKVDQNAAEPPAVFEDSSIVHRLNESETPLNAIWQSIEILRAELNPSQKSPGPPPPPLPNRK